MPRKSTKKILKPVRPQLGEGVEILNAGSVLEDPITRTLETNYMPYAMSVIVSRALINLIYGRQKKLTSVHIGQIWRPDPAKVQAK